MLLYGKLKTRGFKGDRLYRYFLRFCSQYPVCTKYTVTDGESLWEKITNSKLTTSYSVYDYDAIRGIILPCKIKLKDVYYKEKATFSSVLNPCTIRIKKCNISDSTKYENVNTVSKPCVSPKGLTNPKNHCYVNSVLQILHRIFLQFPEHVHINNNKEGSLVQSFLDSTKPNTGNDLTKFKLQLASFNRFYDGSNQQDAYECFSGILDLLHIGTKESLLSDIPMDGDDECIYSLTQHMFSFVIKMTLQCDFCRYLSNAYNQSRVHVTSASGDASINHMLESDMCSKLTKRCTRCLLNNPHEKSSTFIQPPQILSVVINRFDQTSKIHKNTYKISLDRNMLVDGSEYHLIGSIHHHGNTFTSGHYTCNIFYGESAYTCNDNHILPLNCIEPSETIYMVFYARSDIPTQSIQRMGARSHDTGTSSA